MTLVTDIDLQLGPDAARLERVAATASHGRFLVLGVDAFFHGSHSHRFMGDPGLYRTAELRNVRQQPVFVQGLLLSTLGGRAILQNCLLAVRLTGNRLSRLFTGVWLALQLLLSECVGLAECLGVGGRLHLARPFDDMHFRFHAGLLGVPGSTAGSKSAKPSGAGYRPRFVVWLPCVSSTI